MKTPSQILHEAIASIDRGRVSATARASGVSVAYIMKIRAKPVSVGIDQFRGLCIGLGKSADELLGLRPAEIQAGIIAEQNRHDAEKLARDRKALERAAHELQAALDHLDQIKPRE